MSVLHLGITTGMILFFAIAGMAGVPIEMYEDAVMLRTPAWFTPTFQINGFIVRSDIHPDLSDYGDFDDSFAQHEYGHYIQQKKQGFNLYFIATAIPSLIGCVVVRDSSYWNFPWEAEANRLSKNYFLVE